VGVEAGRDQDQLGLEAGGGGEDLPLEQRDPELLFAAGRDRQVDREPLARPRAGVLPGAAAGEDAALVDAGEEDVFDITVPGPASWLADGIVRT